VLSDAFRRSRADIDGSMLGLKKVRPRQLSTMMRALLGFQWRADLSFEADFLGTTAPYGVIDMMEDSLIGYEVLAGGLDDYTVTRPVHTVSPTVSLVFQAVANHAAGFVVERDFGAAGPIPERVLTIGPDETDEAAVRAQLAQLHVAFYGDFGGLDSPEVDAAYALFGEALELANGDARRAWKTTLSALLQDSRLLFY